MVKTKKEILMMATDSGDMIVQDHQLMRGAKPVYFKAMELWANQEAIEFRKWMDTWGYRTTDNKYYFNQVPEAGKQTLFTLEELYSLYLKSNNNDLS